MSSAINEFQSADAFEQQQEQEHQQQQLNQQMMHEAMLQRSAPFSDMYLQHQQQQQQQHLHQQDAHHQVPTPPHSQQQHSQSLSFDYTISATAPRSAEHEGGESDMWLLTQFAPAMSKAVRRKSIDKSERMEDESNQGDCEEQARPAKWRLQWATEDSPPSLPKEFADGVHLVAARNEVTGIQLRLSSNKDFQVTTDCANWFQAQGHAPRASPRRHVVHPTASSSASVRRRVRGGREWRPDDGVFRQLGGLICD